MRTNKPELCLYFMLLTEQRANENIKKEMIDYIELHLLYGTSVGVSSGLPDMRGAQRLNPRWIGRSARFAKARKLIAATSN